MTIASTADLLQAINRTVTGISTGGAPAFASYTTLTNADGVLKDSLLPLAISWAEKTEMQVIGNTEYELYTDWGIYVYAARKQQANMVAGTTTSMTLAQNFMSKYLDKDSYSVTDAQFILAAGPPTIYVNRTAPITHLFSSLETNIIYSGIEYHGFKLGVQTKEEGTL